MTNRNIQMKKRENNQWLNLFPVSLTENIYDKAGTSVDDLLINVKNDQENFKTELSDDLDQRDQLINDRIQTRISIKDYNVDPTGTNDSFNGFQQALNELSDNGVLVLEPDATYRLSDKLETTGNKHITIEGNGSTLLSEVGSGTHQESRALSFKGVQSHDITMNNGLKMGTNVLTVNSTDDIGVNDLLHVQADEVFNASRSYYKKGGMVSVGRILSSTQIQINESFPYEIASTVNTKISVIKPITVHVKDLTIVGTHSTPLGYFGLAIEHSLNSTISNVFSDNFNHCFHIRLHVNTIATHLKSGRSLFSGSTESYGFASFIGTNLSIKHSTFNSGRHGLEISGTENSFKTTIENVTAVSETTSVSFNLHQACYDVTVKNSIFDSIGLAGHVTMENCTIGNKTTNLIKTGIRYRDSSYAFKHCIFTGTTNVFLISDDAQTQPNNSNVIGGLHVEKCFVETRLQLNLSVTYFESVLDILTIKDTNNVNVNVNTDCKINRAIIENCTISHGESFIVGATGRISDLVIRDCVLQQRYNAFILTRFNKILFDNVSVDKVDTVTNPRIEITSKDGAGTPFGEVTLLNSDLTRFSLNTGGFHKLTMINSDLTMTTALGRNSITNILGTTLTDLK